MNEQEFEKKVQQRMSAPKGVDPALGNGAKRSPKPVDRAELGRKAYERIKSKIRR